LANYEISEQGAPSPDTISQNRFSFFCDKIALFTAGRLLRQSSGYQSVLDNRQQMLSKGIIMIGIAKESKNFFP